MEGRVEEIRQQLTESISRQSVRRLQTSNNRISLRDKGLL